MPVTRLTLLKYAIMMLILGFAGSFINPHDKSIGWYDTGKTALIVCGAGAAIALILRAVIAKGGKAERIGALIAAGVTFLFIAKSGQSVFEDGRKWADGDADKWLKVFLMAAVLVISINAFVRIVGEIRSRPADD